MTTDQVAGDFGITWRDVVVENLLHSPQEVLHNTLLLAGRYNRVGSRLGAGRGARPIR